MGRLALAQMVCDLGPAEGETVVQMGSWAGWAKPSRAKQHGYWGKAQSRWGRRRDTATRSKKKADAHSNKDVLEDALGRSASEFLAAVEEFRRLFFSPLFSCSAVLNRFEASNWKKTLG